LTIQKLHALYVGCREQDDREASPTATIIDGQSVKSAEKGSLIHPHGHDRARKSRARSATFPHSRRTLGLLLHAIVHPAALIAV
jgi:putative transposase